MAFGFGRIEYDGNVIDLQRPWTSFQPRKPVSSDTSQAQSGIEQTAKFFSQHFIDARLNLLSPQEKSELLRLFEFAEGGDSFTLIRDRNLGAYINFEGGINPTAAPRGLKTNDDVDGTFTRTDAADSAWYLDEGTGLLTVRDVVDQARFPAGKFGAGIQMDGAAVNLIDQPSGPFNTNNWSSTLNMSFAADTTETKDPADGNVADKLTATGTPGFTTNITGTAKGNKVAGAVWLKCPFGTVAARVVIGGSTSGTEEKLITVTTEWRRYFVQGDSTAWVGTIGFTIRIDTSGDILYAWGAALYDSAEFDLGTVGPLSAASVTRNAEKLLFPSANVLNREKGTIAIRFKPRWAAAAHDIAVLFNSGQSDSIRHILIRVLGTGFIEVITNLNNSSTQHFAKSFDATSLLTQDVYADYVLTYDATISNGFLQYVDGILRDTSSNTPFNINEVQTNFSLGSDLIGNAPAFCNFDEILILNGVVLTANEIQGFFNLGIGLGVPRNRWTVKLADQTWNPRWLHSDVYDIPLLLKEVLT